MHASSIIALALGATAVSAAAMPNAEVKRACDPYCQFPAYVDCPVENGKNVSRQRLIDAVVNGDRSEPPRENSAANLATRHCGNPRFSGIPLWTASLPDEKKEGYYLGAIFYAMAPNGTFYFCSTSSGRVPSGYPDSCTEY